ncbi:MAG: putative PIG3 family NAD(P)H quinone oxidoreductase [Oleiphilaceae bacterium]|jgi:putative PIG3 family NAD(P)H quinone oxidoreductase
MKYIDTPTFGGPEVLILSEGQIPAIAANEILIHVSAAGVNRPDVIQRSGNYPAPKGASQILGLEVAGKVKAVGNEVSAWKIGDRVCALTNGGGYAEFVAVPEGQCLPIPEGLSMVEAAALPETAFTVWSNVFNRAELKTGESFLVHGGSSGIGTTAIQFAHAMGATVFTTAGSQEKCNTCLALGAQKAINYHETDFLEELKETTDGKGVDVILDMVGGDYIQKNLKLAAVEGRIINIAYLQGPVATVNFLPIMLKRLTVSGSTLRPQSLEVKAQIAQQLLTHIWPLYADKSIKPVIAKVFPLSKASDAHCLMESNEHIGKIVLDLSL